MRIGAHISIAGGVDLAPGRAAELGCDCLQIFSKNPRGWSARPLSEAEAEGTKTRLQELGLDPLVVHITYLVNVASTKPDLYEKSLNGLITDLERSGRIGARYLVLHPGKYTDTSLEEGIQRIADSINAAFARVPNDVILLLENVAGAGTEIGRTVEELQQIIERVGDQRRIGVCFDTCHGFAAGYDLRTQESVDRVFLHFDRVMGMERLKIIHTNDAKAVLGSNLDRHEHIGLGAIGEEGFLAIMRNEFVRQYDIPFILETPDDEVGGFAYDIAKMRELAERV